MPQRERTGDLAAERAPHVTVFDTRPDIRLSSRVQRRAGALAGLALLWTLFFAAAGLGVLALAAPVLAAGAVAVAFAAGRRRPVGAGRYAGAVRASLGRGRAVATGRPLALGRAMLTGIDPGAAARRAFERSRRIVSALASATPRISLRAVATHASTLRRSVETWRRPSPHEEARRLSHASADLREQGRHEEAVVSAEVAVRLFASLGDRRREARALNRLALALAAAGRPAHGIPALQRAATLLAELGEQDGAGRVTANLGVLHQQEGRADLALDCWRDALERFEPEAPERERLAERLRVAGAALH